MPGVAVSRALRGSRKRVALVCSDGQQRTAQEIAHGLGRPTGAVFGLIGRMCDDGVLEPDSPAPTRGTQYRLTEAGRRALEEALAEEAAIGQLAEGQWVLIVEPTKKRDGLSRFMRVLEQPSLSGSVAWSVELGWGWMLSFAPEADAFQVQDLRYELESQGFPCRQAKLASMVSGARMREHAATLARRRL